MVVVVVLVQKDGGRERENAIGTNERNQYTKNIKKLSVNFFTIYFATKNYIMTKCVSHIGLKKTETQTIDLAVLGVAVCVLPK